MKKLGYLIGLFFGWVFACFCLGFVFYFGWAFLRAGYDFADWLMGLILR